MSCTNRGKFGMLFEHVAVNPIKEVFKIIIYGLVKSCTLQNFPHVKTQDYTKAVVVQTKSINDANRGGGGAHSQPRPPALIMSLPGRLGRSGARLAISPAARS